MRSVVEVNGLRQLLKLQSPPRGTPSRVLSARLRRCLQQRSLSTEASAGTIPPQHASPNIPIIKTGRSQSNGLKHARDQPKILAKLLSAVQSQNHKQVFAELQALGRHERSGEAIEALSSLSKSAFSELVRSLDPFRVGPRADLSHGLYISQGLRNFSPVSSMMNQFGIRKIYHNSTQLIRAVLLMRLNQGRELMLSDYIVLLRCAGAASDIETAKWIWKVAMKADREKDPTVRGGLAYTEFMKARFLTEPLYMQNDMARFRVRPRDLTGHRKRFADKSALRRLERLRLSIATNKTSLYGRAPDQPSHDLHRKVSLHQPVRRIWSAVRKQRIRVDQELLGAYLIACGRAGSVRELLRRLWQTWRIRTTDIKDHRATKIVGGIEPDLLDPLTTPNLRILNAIVHAFGSTGHVILARKFLIFFSTKYEIQVPPETWSSLLEWTYVMSSKPAITEWKIMGDRNRIIDAEDVFIVWDLMTSGHGPYCRPVKPTFKDRDFYVKSLIAARKFESTWDEIRRGAALYESICEEVESSLFERLYPSPPAEAVTRHLQAKVKQHTTWYTIERWCRMWLMKGSKLERKDDNFTQRTITEFIAEFSDFLPNPATYKTSAGTVRIATPQNIMRQSWKMQIARSHPTTVRVPDRSSQKFTTMKETKEDEPDAPLIPVVTEKGTPLYEMQTLALKRWMKKMVSQRSDSSPFGSTERKLNLLYLNEDDQDQVGPAVNEEMRRIQKGRFKQRLILRSLFW
ncbi:hypothetical protein CkaCkLH20_04551 [Colletotrichum karsti]|uniref:Pentatricopeptide repeat domain-containing protein n=1 Tax=Colletotrichum karsti TaxID=1095194 RepID=A0A9P6IFV7_9PEZI|nr:uncharacterized protein CkaCkLH20_04551 [Colletotrichum karsti]KAF9877975.1 hypothetical protein CkaCkLH20_04551 [Colletotrichum karsti]